MGIGTSDGKYYASEFEHVAQSFVAPLSDKDRHQAELDAAIKKVLEKGKQQRRPPKENDNEYVHH
jgi:hypothetical protein